MKRSIVVLALLFLSCEGSNWPESERTAFIENCERASGGETDYCACALEEVQDMESDPNDITAGQMAEAAQACRDEL